MKAKALTVRECSWLSEECQRADDLDSQRDGLCLPNIFRSKKVKPLARVQAGQTQPVYYTAKELLLEVLDRGAVRELTRRAAAVKTGMRSQSKEQNVELSEGEYAEALTWFSIVLQSGLTVGVNCSFRSELTLKLDGWQGVLKRNSFQTSLLSLTRLEEADKLEILSAFCSYVTRRYQVLHTHGSTLAVKKYRLSCHPLLHLALLCDISSGFICNMYLYCPQQLQKQSKKTVVEQVLGYLLRPFCSHRHLIQLDKSACMEGRLTDILSGSEFHINFVPSVQQTSEDSLSQQGAHLQGWTGPALFPLSDLQGSSAVDVFLPGLWAVLHIICINTFVLHTLQSSGSGTGKTAQLTEFTRSLASQLALDSSITVPVLQRLNSTSCQETSLTRVSKQRTNKDSGAQRLDRDRRGSSSAVRLHRPSRPGVCGLDNSGNSCYLNVVLQCLCSTVPLVEHFLNPDTRKELARAKCRVAEVFVRLLQEMWLGKNSSCAPVEARCVLTSILPQFNNYSQQDAQELLLFLLNALHEDLKKVSKQQVRSMIRQPRQEQRRNHSTAAGESTIVSRVFEGELSYMTLCMHCDHQAHSMQSFTVLSLPLPTGTIKCSLQNCLSLFFEQTILTGGEQMLCSVCGLRRETAVLTCLEKPPEILMLHLKRFGCKGKSQVKLKTNVLFSMKLDLNPFLSSSMQNPSFSSYRLYAVVNHSGHLNMGHYTAVCYSSLTRTWHCFDDSAVREVQDGHVQSPNAYMLLYSRKPFQKPKISGL